jgi:hypothetical protein
MFIVRYNLVGRLLLVWRCLGNLELLSQTSKSALDIVPLRLIAAEVIPKIGIQT